MSVTVLCFIFICSSHFHFELLELAPVAFFSCCWGRHGGINVSTSSGWLGPLNKHLELPQAHRRSDGVCKWETLPSESASGGLGYTTDLQMITSGNAFLHNFHHKGRAPWRIFVSWASVKKKLRSQETALLDSGCENKISVCTVWKPTVEVWRDLFCFFTQGSNASAVHRSCSWSFSPSLHAYLISNCQCVHGARLYIRHWLTGPGLSTTFHN